MSEPSGYNEEAHFDAELNTRIALQIGQQVMAGTAAALRAEFAERRAGNAAAQLAQIRAELEALRADSTGAHALAERLTRALEAVPPKNLPAWYVTGEPAPSAAPEDEGDAGAPVEIAS
jgi:hypothetical protein